MYRSTQILYIKEDAWMNSSYEHLNFSVYIYSTIATKAISAFYIQRTSITLFHPTITSTITVLLRRAKYPNCRRSPLLHDRQIENVEVL